MSKLYRVEPNGTVITTTQSGWIVECMPVGDLLLKVGQNLQRPDEPEPPTYEMIGAGGATETRPHDADSIKDPKTTDEDRAAWEVYSARKTAYDAKIAEIDATLNEMRGQFMALEGVRIRGLPDDLEGWAKRQSRFGFEIDASTPDELLLAFVDHNVIRTARDGAQIMAGILRATGLDQEAMDAAEATFLDSLAGPQGRGDDSGDSGVSGEGAPENE